MKLFLIVYVDDFKLSGPEENLRQGWDLILSPSDTAPKGIDMDEPEPVGRYLGCEHRVSERWIDWQGTNPTVLDPPPPKESKNKDSEENDTTAAAGIGFNELDPGHKKKFSPTFCDRTFAVPLAQNV